jgi:AcrR family transcriptional regulator
VNEASTKGRSVAPSQVFDAALDDAPDGNAKRRQIMDGARTVFLAAGFDGASMNDVARAAGVSKGTLYVYFESKEQLFEALIREERRQQAERLTELPFESRDVRGVLLKFGCQLIEMMSRPDTLAHIRTVIAAAGKFPQLGRAFFEAGPCFGANRLADYMHRMNAEGALRIADVDRAAWQFMDLCQAGTFKPLLFCMVDELSPADIEAGVRAAVDVFMAAYGNPASAEG